MVLRQLRSYGFQRIKISVGHKAEILMAVVATGKSSDSRSTITRRNARSAPSVRWPK